MTFSWKDRPSRPTLDPATFVDAKGYRSYTRKPSAGGDRASRTTPYDSVVTALKGLLEHYEERAGATQLQGAHLASLEISTSVLGGIIALVLWIGAAVVLVFCALRWITDPTLCYIAYLIFSFGLWIICILYTTLTGGGGTCEWDVL